MLSILSSIWTWIAIVVLILFWLPLLAIIRLFDRDPAHYTTGRWFRRLGVAMTYVNPMWSVNVDTGGLENPRNPYIVICNHQSMADIPIVSSLPWEMKWVGKKSLFQIPFAGQMMRLAGDISVDRSSPRSGAQALMAAREYLELNCSVLFFAEGTRSTDGRVGKFNEGAFGLAIKTGTPILPIALDGTVNALPKDSWIFGRSGEMFIKALKPIPTEGLKRADVGALAEETRIQIMNQIADWRGVDPAAVDGTLDSPSKDTSAS